MTQTATKKPDLSTLRSAMPHGNQKLDEEKCLDLINKGVSKVDTAKILGVDKSTVFRFLQRNQQDIKTVDAFRDSRSHFLARRGLKAHIIKEMIYESLIEEGEEGFAQLSAKEKSGILRDVTISDGTDYDKERLERDLSTSNVSLQALTLDGERIKKEREELKERLKRLRKSAESGPENADIG